MKAKLIIDSDKRISKIDKRIYGSFIEHLGRAVYGGIYDPGQATADDMGFRKDVMDAIKKLQVPVVRYPGGNFVSGYNWEDGTGDKALRPKKLELAWNSIETNEVGIDEFQEWAKRANTEVMMAVNLGTRGADEARNLVEYCNSKTDTYYANMRRKNGFEEPFDIKLWCLGNEMDGEWQIGAKTPTEYARVAKEAAKVMKMVDDSIELVACGSCHPGMPTYRVWEEEVLREAYDYVDYLSLHSYYGNYNDDTADYLGCALIMDKFIKEVAGICDKIKEEKKSEKQINLSFDEWNVWFHSNGAKIDKWQIAPPLLEDIYNLEDALIVGTLLNTFVNNSDRVKIACLAQLVNVIAPIMTETGGRMWLQTIFYPYYYTSVYGRGTALKVECDCEKYNTEHHTDIPYADVSAVLSEDENQIAVFAVNRSLDKEMDLEIAIPEGFKLVEHVALSGDDLKAVNSADEPEKVVPHAVEVSGEPKLEKASWNMLVYKKN